jgi:hypothetical protein
VSSLRKDDKADKVDLNEEKGHYNERHLVFLVHQKQHLVLYAKSAGPVKEIYRKPPG